MIYALVLISMCAFSFYIGSIYGRQVQQEISLKVFNTFYTILCDEFGEDAIKAKALRLAEIYGSLSKKQ